MEEQQAPERFTVSVGMGAGLVRISVAGELDQGFATLLERVATEAWAVASASGLVLDLRGLTFCDSRCVGVLLLLLRQSREQKAALVVAGVPQRLERILTMTGLRAMFRVEPSLEAAIEVVRAWRESQGSPDRSEKNSP
ncbi:anti-anti-sigma factor [Nonomuraea thailandensis]|uniref:Anti-sigma factor antagonist n=1 Tax=Nonomuraea thailandensis TaxID=1188745 RepID=A0A9X2GP83_9ACTN|nr:STAS domain-containing protein [Nonomuraea thailandensis]MCP2358308.1 anti-anti-sigma factor [Nonomuraea thailandensis]